MGYLEYFPPGYHDSHDKLYPLLVFAHGSGEVGSGTFEDLDKVMSWGPPSHIKNGHNMCFTVDGAEECFVVLSPQFPQADIWQTYVGELLEYVSAHPGIYKIDPRRVYITGLSRGGQLTYAFATNTLYKAYTPAAIAPVSSPMLDMDGCLISKRKIAVWAFHGRLDTVVPWAMGQLAFKAVDDCLDPVPTAEMKFTTYEDRYHDAWIPAYDPGHSVHDPNLYEWFLTKVREPEAIVGNEPDSLLPGVYPNPATEETYVEYDDETTVGLAVHTLTGQEARQIPSGVHTVNLEGLPPAVYIVTVKSKNGTIRSERVVKMNRAGY